MALKLSLYLYHSNPKCCLNHSSVTLYREAHETPVVAPSKEEKKKNAAQKEKKSRRKIKIKLSLPGKEKDVKKHLEFIFTLDKDTPDGLANEIFHAREDLGISLVEEQIVKVANTIRKSVNLVKLKVRQSYESLPNTHMQKELHL